MMIVAVFFITVLISVSLMLGLLIFVRRQPAARHLGKTNDIAGFYVTLFGALYGVFVGFMVLAVWTRFDQAETLTEQEATALVSVYALSSDLPAPIREPLRRDLIAYSEAVVSDEWPAMAAGNYHAEKTFRLMISVWRDVAKIRPATMAEQVVMDQTFSRMNEMYGARRLRLLSSERRLPGVFWAVLIIGAIITIGSTTLFGVEKFAFHAIKTALLTILVVVILSAIWEIDLPFRDTVRVSPQPFIQTTALMKEIQATEARESAK